MREETAEVAGRDHLPRPVADRAADLDLPEVARARLVVGTEVEERERQVADGLRLGARVDRRTGEVPLQLELGPRRGVAAGLEQHDP